jgi:hypothetical protein
MSRSWRAVSKAIQRLAVNTGMFPYETHYVLATYEEVGRLYDSGNSNG